MPMASSSKILEQELDHISNLPEPIRCLIVSRLPVEELVRTSVLSKRWQHTWKNVPHLNFDVTRITKTCRQLFHPIQRDRLNNPFKSFAQRAEYVTEQLRVAAQLVNTILSAHVGPITSCKIFQFPIGFQEPIDSIIYLTRVKGVQKLSLSGRQCMKPPLPFPSWGNTLQVLEISNYAIEDASIFQGCDGLHTLRFKTVELGNEVMDEILTYCQIRELRLRSCTGIEDLVISDKNLKILELQRMSFRVINIYAESLAVLVLDNIECPVTCLIIEAPSVVKFYAFRVREKQETGSRRRRDCFEMEDLLSRCSGILGSSNDGTQTFYVSPFKKLQMLSATVNLNNIREAIVLSYFLQECSSLKTLQIYLPGNEVANVNQTLENHLSYPEHLFWDRKETFESVQNNLSRIWIGGCRGTELEMGFAKYVITRAPKMKKIAVECVQSCTNDVLRLLKLPKASMDLSVVVKHPLLKNA